MKRKNLLRLAIVAAVTATTAVVPSTASAAPVALAVVTANLGAKNNSQVNQDWKVFGPQAHIVLVQEAKYVNLREILGDTWIVRQDTSSDARQGSAIAIRRSIAAEVGELNLTKGTDAHPCDSKPGGILTRYIAHAGVRLHNGRWLRVASAHMPPVYCQLGPGGPYDVMAENVKAFANSSERLTVIGGDWNKIVDQDPNNIGAATGYDPAGPNDGSRIDGFYTSPGIGHNNPVYLPRTSSDHRPVIFTISVPS